MANSLGTLGVVRDQPQDDDPVTFDWFGLTVRAQAEFNEVELVDLMETSKSIDVNDMSAATVVKDMLRMVIRPDDFDGFWTKARENRQRIEDLAQVFEVLIEALTGRPTPRQSDSSSGLPSTPPSSQAVSSLPASSGRPHRPDLVIIGEDDAVTRARVAAAVAG